MQIDEKTYNYSNTKFITETKAKSQEKYKKQYSAYIKKSIDPEHLGKMFSEAKEKIMKGEK